MIRRKPNGQFCDQFSTLWEWLPSLFSQTLGHAVFEVCLKRLAQYCVDRAADSYEEAASVYRPNDHRRQEEASASWGQHRHDLAQKWLQRRDILLKCLADLEALR